MRRRLFFSFQVQMTDGSKDVSSVRMPTDVQKPLALNVHDEPDEILPIIRLVRDKVVWERVEYAMRIAFIGVLPTALLAYHSDTTKVWFLPPVMVTYCIVCSQMSFVSALDHFLQTARSLVLVILLGLMCFAIDPSGRNDGSWGALFAGVTFLVALFTQSLVTKMGLFGWSVMMVLQFKHHFITHNKYSGPPEYAKANILGAAFGLLTACLPYPYFETWKAQALEKKIFKLLVQQFEGITECAYADKLTRSARLAALRRIHRDLETNVVEYRKYLELSALEIWFAARQHAMRDRLVLLMRIVRNCDAALEAIESAACQKPSWDESDLHQKFGEIVLPHMRGAAAKFREFMQRLAKAYDDQIRQEVVATEATLDQDFQSAREQVILPLLDSDMSTNVFSEYPFLSVSAFLFPWRDCISALSSFTVSPPPSVWGIVKHFLLFPVRDAQDFVSSVVGIYRFEKRMMVRVREAFKLTFAATTAFALLLHLKTQEPFRGAVFIGFLMDADPNNNTAKGVRFLLGCVFGSAFGLLCNSVSDTLTQTIIWIVVITLVTGFGKPGSKHGETMFFTMFYALSAMTPSVTSSELIEFIQQDVVSICWLAFISNFFWPMYPTTNLHNSVRTSIVEARNFIVTYLSAFVEEKRCVPFVHLHAFDQMHKLRVDVYKQVGLIEAAYEEPTVQLAQFPSHIYRDFNANMRRFVAHHAPLVTAAEFVMRRGQKVFTLTSIEHSLSELVDSVDVLMSMMVELVQKPTRTRATCSTDAVIVQMSDVQRRCDVVVSEAKKGYIEERAMTKCGTHRTPDPFEIPASHMIVAAIERLPAELNALVLAVIAVHDTRLCEK